LLLCWSQWISENKQQHPQELQQQQAASDSTSTWPVKRKHSRNAGSGSHARKQQATRQQGFTQAHLCGP